MNNPVIGPYFLGGGGIGGGYPQIAMTVRAM